MSKTCFEKPGIRHRRAAGRSGRQFLIQHLKVCRGYHPPWVGRDSSRIDGLGKTQRPTEKREHDG